MNHTPGPWKVYDPENLAPYVGTMSKNPNKGWDHDTICNLYEDVADAYERPEYQAIKNAKANGQLIAAAPDLLEAIKTLLGETEDSDYMTASEKNAKARAAIAKATGETK
jgi:hypothetical protein